MALGIETGGVYQYIGFVLHSICGPDAARRNALDSCGDQRNIIPCKRGVEIARDQHAFAADWVIRRQYLAKCGVLDAFLEEPVILPHGVASLNIVSTGLDDRVSKPVVTQEQEQAIELSIQGKVSETPLLESEIAPVVAGDDIVGGSLEQAHPGHGFGNFRYDLHGTGGRADDRDFFARKFHIVPPRGRMPLLARKRFCTLDFGDQWNVQCAGAIDHVPRPHPAAICECHLPKPGFILESGHFDAFPMLDERPQAVLVNAAFRIGLDFIPRRVFARPIGVRFEGKAIEVRHHIAGSAGVTVPVPGAADFRCLVKDAEVSDARIQQAFSDADAREAGTDDQRIEGVVFVVAHAVYNNPIQQGLDHASNHIGRWPWKPVGGT